MQEPLDLLKNLWLAYQGQLQKIRTGTGSHLWVSLIGPAGTTGLNSKARQRPQKDPQQWAPSRCDHVGEWNSQRRISSFQSLFDAEQSAEQAFSRAASISNHEVIIKLEVKVLQCPKLRVNVSTKNRNASGRAQQDMLKILASYFQTFSFC